MQRKKKALLLLNQKSIYFVCLSLANLFYLVVCDCSIQRLVMTSQTIFFLNPSICSRHSDEMNKLSMKVSLQKRELLPYITLVRDNQLACYRWLYMYVFFKSLDLNVMEEWMFTYVMIHMFCALHQQETSSWLFDLEYKHQYWKICVHLILRIVDWR